MHYTDLLVAVAAQVQCDTETALHAGGIRVRVPPPLTKWKDSLRGSFHAYTERRPGTPPVHRLGAGRQEERPRQDQRTGGRAFDGLSVCTHHRPSATIGSATAATITARLEKPTGRRCPCGRRGAAVEKRQGLLCRTADTAPSPDKVTS